MCDPHPISRVDYCLLQVDAALDDTQQVAAAVYGPDVSTVHPKGPPVFGHAAQQGLHHSQHPPHHGHLEQPDMQGFGQPQPLPGPTFAPPLPPGYIATFHVPQGSCIIGVQDSTQELLLPTGQGQ